MTLRRSRSPMALLGALATLLAGTASGGDVLRPLNISDSDIGALVDGVRGGVQVNDEGYVHLPPAGFFGVLFPAVPLADFTSGPGEVIAFAHRRPPILLPDVAWSPASNSVDVAFDDPYRIDVHVWIVDPSSELPAAVLEAGLTTSLIWDKERQGLAFGTFEPHDATTDPDAAQFLDFHCGLADTIQSAIGYVDGAVNVYYVTTVDFGLGAGTGSGVWCGNAPSVIGMGRSTSDHLLAHELGHALSLSHTNENTLHFDGTNVMHNSSGVRQYLTEGQTFRAVYNPGSAINAIYDVRAGSPTRACSHSYVESNELCPAVQTRVWADGASWPPN
jgi:hypothetical protein